MTNEQLALVLSAYHRQLQRIAVRLECDLSNIAELERNEERWIVSKNTRATWFDFAYKDETIELRETGSLVILNELNEMLDELQMDILYLGEDE